MLPIAYLLGFSKIFQTYVFSYSGMIQLPERNLYSCWQRNSPIFKRTTLIICPIMVLQRFRNVAKNSSFTITVSLKKKIIKHLNVMLSAIANGMANIVLPRQYRERAMEFQTGPKMVRIMIIVFDMMEQKKKSKQLRTQSFTSC